MKDTAEEIFNRSLDYIKTSIKRKIAIYDPLDFNPTVKGFLRWLQDDDYKKIREIPGDCPIENYFDNLIKIFLIENAYFALEKKYILYRFMKQLNISNPNDIQLLEIAEFITGEIEKDELKRLKKFEEKCKFKTFLSTAVTRLLIDYWRKKGTIRENVTTYEPEFHRLFDEPQKDPYETLIHQDHEEMKKKAAEFLPHILDKLNSKEKLAIKLKYEKNMKLSAIARTFGVTRFKTGQLIIEIEKKISMGILPGLKKGGYHETPGR